MTDEPEGGKADGQQEQEQQAEQAEQQTKGDEAAQEGQELEADELSLEDIEQVRGGQLSRSMDSPDLRKRPGAVTDALRKRPGLIGGPDLIVDPEKKPIP